jgi:hypothetical protein
LSAFNTIQQHHPTTTAKPAAGSFFAPATQAKLTINQPGDAHEQEADQVADQVVQRLATSPSEKANTPSPSACHLPPATIQTKCANCEQEEKLQQKEEEEKPLQGKIQRKPIFDSNADEKGSGDNSAQVQCKENNGGETSASPDFSSRLSASKGSGSPMSDDTRA